MRTVIVGEVAGRTSDEPLDPASQSGGRLADLAGLDHEEFLDRFDRINIIPSIFEEQLDPAFMRLRWKQSSGCNLRSILHGRRVILLGAAVAGAMGVADQPHFRWFRTSWGVASVIPHPSGKNRWWNEPDNVSRARHFMRRALLPCVHVEGPDGCGKSTLIPELKSLLGTDDEPVLVVPTEGPPHTYAECEDRIAQRIKPGIVSDRSSGLISELVYGPVLRDGVCGYEPDFWAIIRSLIGVVTFVYCRPPSEFLRPNFRPDEPDDFASEVLANMSTIAIKYDEVMQRVVSMGGRVIIYDRTSMIPEDIARCVV